MAYQPFPSFETGNYLEIGEERKDGNNKNSKRNKEISKAHFIAVLCLQCFL